MNAIFNRTSVRKYKEKEVEEEKIELLLKAAMAAPSAANQQPWEFYVIKNREVLDKLSTCSPYSGCSKEAPIAIITCYKKDVMLPAYVEIDLSACTENILLEASELGLGSVWLGIAPEKDRMEKVKEIVGIPDEIEAFAIIPIGYPLQDTVQKERYDATRVHVI